ncbi:hypothetical protein H696_01609 [Fonticula alba]|uniref:[Histone H3]-trimethyl-L-lysine(4) demethylase n=1 Tax=Fonticula alba TaxID=691883 RepID=A0A058ZCU9_FONAL|nr:hypothetical protein H696_01609 [Fonticula alba]KCV72209.1 hypothetical protein H696_01609 [Fonticula alba]|eukprot:XP_009493787.1 hypothetical protein H696_01609 [Fonticula alba]
MPSVTDTSVRRRRRTRVSHFGEPSSDHTRSTAEVTHATPSDRSNLGSGPFNCFKAPEFFPAMEDFQDPLAYIDSIRQDPTVLRAGILKIVPPPEWTAKFAPSSLPLEELSRLSTMHNGKLVPTPSSRLLGRLFKTTFLTRKQTLSMLNIRFRARNLFFQAIRDYWYNGTHLCISRQYLQPDAPLCGHAQRFSFSQSDHSTLLQGGLTVDRTQDPRSADVYFCAFSRPQCPVSVRIPSCNVTIDLWTLHSLVEQFGAFGKPIRHSAWHNVASRLVPPTTPDNMQGAEELLVIMQHAYNIHETWISPFLYYLSATKDLLAAEGAGVAAASPAATSGVIKSGSPGSGSSTGSPILDKTCSLCQSTFRLKAGLLHHPRQFPLTRPRALCLHGLLASSSSDPLGSNSRSSKRPKVVVDVSHDLNSDLLVFPDSRQVECFDCKQRYHAGCLLAVGSSLPDEYQFSGPNRSTPIVVSHDWSCPLCLKRPDSPFGFLEGSNYTLERFQRFSENFMRNYLRMHKIEQTAIEADPALLETEFWSHVGDSDGFLEVEYGADFELPEPGPANPDPIPWDIAGFSTQKGSLLRYLNGHISGVTQPWVYIGMLFSAFCWHTEDHDAYSINFNHFGATKTWYGIPSSDALMFERLMKQESPEVFNKNPNQLFDLVSILSPSVLRENGVQVSYAHQRPGEFIVTLPRAYHSGFNQGFNVAEAVNFLPPDWAPFGRECQEKYSFFKIPPVFSQDRLTYFGLLSSAMGRSLSSYEFLVRDFEKTQTQEITRRRALLAQGLELVSLSGLDPTFCPAPDPQKGLPATLIAPTSALGEDPHCHFCLSLCFHSAVFCPSSRRFACLQHVDNLMTAAAGTAPLAADTKSPSHPLKLAIRLTDQMLMDATAIGQQRLRELTLSQSWSAKVVSALDTLGTRCLDTLRLLANPDHPLAQARAPVPKSMLPTLRTLHREIPVDPLTHFIQDFVELADYLNPSMRSKRGTICSLDFEHQSLASLDSKSIPHIPPAIFTEGYSVDDLRRVVHHAKILRLLHPSLGSMIELLDRADLFIAKADTFVHTARMDFSPGLTQPASDPRQAAALSDIPSPVQTTAGPLVGRIISVADILPPTKRPGVLEAAQVLYEEGVLLRLSHVSMDRLVFWFRIYRWYATIYRVLKAPPLPSSSRLRRLLQLLDIYCSELLSAELLASHYPLAATHIRQNRLTLEEAHLLEGLLRDAGQWEAECQRAIPALLCLYQEHRLPVPGRLRVDHSDQPAYNRDWSPLSFSAGRFIHFIDTAYSLPVSPDMLDTLLGAYTAIEDTWEPVVALAPYLADQQPEQYIFPMNSAFEMFGPQASQAMEMRMKLAAELAADPVGLLHQFGSADSMVRLLYRHFLGPAGAVEDLFAQASAMLLAPEQYPRSPLVGDIVISQEMASAPKQIGWWLGLCRDLLFARPATGPAAKAPPGSGQTTGAGSASAVAEGGLRVTPELLAWAVERQSSAAAEADAADTPAEGEAPEPGLPPVFGPYPGITHAERFCLLAYLQWQACRAITTFRSVFGFEPLVEVNAESEGGTEPPGAKPGAKTLPKSSDNLPVLGGLLAFSQVVCVCSPVPDIHGEDDEDTDDDKMEEADAATASSTAQALPPTTQCSLCQVHFHLCAAKLGPVGPGSGGVPVGGEGRPAGRSICLFCQQQEECLPVENAASYATEQVHQTERRLTGFMVATGCALVARSIWPESDVGQFDLTRTVRTPRKETPSYAMETVRGILTRGSLLTVEPASGPGPGPKYSAAGRLYRATFAGVHSPLVVPVRELLFSPAHLDRLFLLAGYRKILETPDVSFLRRVTGLAMAGTLLPFFPAEVSLLLGSLFLNLQLAWFSSQR